MSVRVKLLVCTIFTLLFVQNAQAGQRDGLALSPNCSGFASYGGTIRLDRDNTGAGREAFSISAVDGDGTVLYQGPVESFLVGGAVDFPTGYKIDFTSAPSSNPIVVRVISAEGNGLRAQTIYSGAGRCAGLPTVDQTVISGVTTASLPINTVPPLSNNTDSELRGEAGILIVNTAFLNLRSGDGPEYTIVGRVAGGAKLIPLGHNVDFSWWYVEAGDIIGWTLAELVIPRGDFTNVPEVEPVGVIGLPRFFLFSDQNLLTLADKFSAPVCELTGNLEYEVTAKNSGGTFFYINAGCKDGSTAQGWIPGDFGGLRNPGDLRLPVK